MTDLLAGLNQEQRQHGRPARHGAGVVVAALGLVEGAALPPVVAGPHGADALQAALDLPLLEHADGRGVLEARHHLRVVRERLFGPPAARVAG